MAGREEESEALSGRIPLWMAILPYVQEHPFVGHGYQSFWNSERIESFSYAFQFLVPDGHSAYIETAHGPGRDRRPGFAYPWWCWHRRGRRGGYL